MAKKATTAAPVAPAPASNEPAVRSWLREHRRLVQQVADAKAAQQQAEAAHAALLAEIEDADDHHVIARLQAQLTDAAVAASVAAARVRGRERALAACRDEGRVVVQAAAQAARAMAQVVADDISRRYHACRAALAEIVAEAQALNAPERRVCGAALPGVLLHGSASWSVPVDLRFTAFDAGDRCGPNCGVPLPVILTDPIRRVNQMVADLLEAAREIGSAVGPAAYPEVA